jgi:hypothetical protein
MFTERYWERVNLVKQKKDNIKKSVEWHLENIKPKAYLIAPEAKINPKLEEGKVVCVGGLK